MASEIYLNESVWSSLLVGYNKKQNQRGGGGGEEEEEEKKKNYDFLKIFVLWIF